MPFRAFVLCFVVALSWPEPEAIAQAPIEYRVSFPEPEHHWMQVEVTFPDVSVETLELRMSRSSPGRYAAHDFAKNVYRVEIADGAGRALVAARPNVHQWNVTGHGGTVKVRYRVFGDRVDGTYLAIDATHAHINAPAAFMWARGLDERPIQLTFQAPAGARWKAATQLAAASDPLTFTAPNLQYFMDSPVELSDHIERSFRVQDPRNGRAAEIRLVVHHTGTDAEIDRFAADLERVVREQIAIVGELPMFEGGRYTFLADYLPYASGDGMEHRNSTVMSSRRSLATAYAGLLGTASHEFFHSWNVERIRPASLEPFDFEDANISGELWLAEGFTSYYGDLALVRAGLKSHSDALGELAGLVNGLLSAPGARFRSAVEMSGLAPFVDAAASIDRTNWRNLAYSYYPFGNALALGLDLTLRARSNGKVTLDDFMRGMWTHHGKPGGAAPGLVARPYTIADVRARLAEVSGDARFADEFVDRFIEGTERIDYASLLERAGFLLRRATPGSASLGPLPLEVRDEKLVVTEATLEGTPIYHAGVDVGDEIVSIGGQAMKSTGDVTAILKTVKAGDRLPVVFMRRGARVESHAITVEDPQLELVPVERAGRSLTGAQREFRDAWLGSQVRVLQPAVAGG
jgi:predicted metalloprotease with PDZ domain